VLKNEKYKGGDRLKPKETKQFSVISVANLPSVVVISDAENNKAGEKN